MHHRKWPWFLCLVLLLAGLFPAAAAAQVPPDLQWQWLNPRPTYQDLHFVDYLNGQFLAGGSSGVLLTSADGTAWSVLPAPTTMALESAAYGNGRYVIVGGYDPGIIKSGKGVILASADGKTFAVHHNSPWPLKQVAFGAGRFVAAGTEGILSSDDGLNWSVSYYKSPSYTDLGEAFYSVTFDGKRFVAAGAQRTVASSDGLNWVEIAAGLDRPRWVSYGDGVYIAADSFYWLLSPDAVTWTRVPLNVKPRLIAPFPGLWLATGQSGGILRSYDQGKTWTELRTGSSLSPSSYAYGKGLYVAVGGEGSIWTSRDGTTWTSSQTGLTPMRISKVTTGNGLWVGVAEGLAGSSGQVLLVGKTDGSLRPVPLPQGFMYPSRLYFADGRFFLEDSFNRVASTDGVRWEKAEAPLLQVTADKATFMLGPKMAVSVSFDKKEWKQTNLTSGQGLRVVYGNGRYVAVPAAADQWSKQPAPSTSTDGITWTPITGANLAQVAFGDGRFVATGAQGKLYSSADGLSWTPIPGTENVHAYNIIYAAGRFVAIEAAERLLTSTDGKVWRSRQFGMALINWMEAMDGGLLLIGQDGAVLFGTTGTCGRQFRDVPNTHPACGAAELLFSVGVVSGTTDGRFDPDRNVSRAEFAKMLVIAMGEKPESWTQLPFSDARGHWAVTAGYVQAAVKLKAMGGFPDGTFRPDDPLTRSQVVKIAAALMQLKPEGTAAYTDIPADAWYGGWVAAGAKAGLIGAGAQSPLWAGTAFEGETPVTRAEAAMILANLLHVR